MRIAILLSLLCSTAQAQEFFTHDKMVRPPQSDMQQNDPMVRQAPASTFVDPNVREPSSEPVDVLDADQPAHHDRHHKRHHRRALKPKRDSGVSLSIQGGAFASARNDYQKIAAVIGPSNNPSPFGGMFVLQLTADIRGYMRIGGDFTFGMTRAYGVGSDAGGIEVRQSVHYQMFTGGLLIEGVLPVRDILEFSLGTTLGGGGMRVAANSARINDFNELATDLRAIAKTDRIQLTAPVMHAKPAFGVRARFTKSSIAAFDVRIGVNIYWAPRGTMRLWDDLIVYNSPHIVELQPFVTAGIAFGDWAARRSD